METKLVSVLGCGWLGMPLAQSLSKTFEVKGSTTSQSKLEAINNLGVQSYLINMNSPDERLTEFVQSDVLIINVPPGKQTDQESYESGLNHIVSAMKECDHFPKTIFVSSTAVYPNLNREVFEEDAAMIETPRSGIKLLPAENIFSSNSQIDSVILRFAGLFGPGRDPAKFLAKSKTIPRSEDPVNMIHQQDCIDIIELIINKGSWNKIYNACSPIHPTRKDFYSKAAKSSGLPVPQFDDTESSYKKVSSEKLITDIGYEFTYADPLSAL